VDDAACEPRSIEVLAEQLLGLRHARPVVTRRPSTTGTRDGASDVE
jgi:hypothetical protein